MSVHSIKGALPHLGARKSAQLAARLEEMAVSQQLDGVEDVFREFTQSLIPLTEEMTSFVNRS